MTEKIRVEASTRCYDVVVGDDEVFNTELARFFRKVGPARKVMVVTDSNVCPLWWPTVKGIEFGSGFRGAGLRGSQNNDEFFINGDGEVEAISNNSGGILGGIPTGLGPITFRVAFKPTPSISKPRMSVNMRTMESVKKLVVKGRHDPCVAVRAMPVVEAATAMALYDAWLLETSR